MDIPELRDEMDKLRARKGELEDIIGRRTANQSRVNPPNIVRIFQDALEKVISFQTVFLRCSHCLFPILGQVMGQEVSGHSKIATEKTKKKLQNNWEVDSRRKPLTAEQRFFSLPLLKLQPARLSSGFGRFDNSPESPLVAPVKPYAPFYWQGWGRRLIPVCAAPATSTFVGDGGGLPTCG